MRQFVYLAVVASACLVQSLPTAQQQGTGDPYTRILSYESYQDGANFGHELNQEDGTLSGQKIGPDGLTYGFYSYLQKGGNRVKVFWRAGKGVGYEVLNVEGLNAENLGNLRATISDPTEAPAFRRPAPTRRPVVHNNPVIVTTSAPIPRVPVTHAPITHAPIFPTSSTPAPHRFDYPAVLNLERTANGYVSSLTAV